MRFQSRALRTGPAVLGLYHSYGRLVTKSEKFYLAGVASRTQSQTVVPGVGVLRSGRSEIKRRKKRRGWDLNPRARFFQATRFRGGLFQPLRHLSEAFILAEPP